LIPIIFQRQRTGGRPAATFGEAVNWWFDYRDADLALYFVPWRNWFFVPKSKLKQS